MFRKLWKLLTPFHRVFARFVAILVVYEGLQITEGYLISTVIQLFDTRAVQLYWVALFAGLVIYDELFMRLDNAMDWHIIARHTYPIYKYLKTSAISKFLEMDIPWHQRHNSGALVGKVAHGVEKVNDIVDGLSWEFVPTLIQAFLSLIPLMIFSGYTALIASVAFSFFMILTIRANASRAQFREQRHNAYEQEWHRSIEVVQAAETNVMFGQQARLSRELEVIHDKIVGLGLTEARLGIFTYNRWRIRILTIARRLILLIWVMQLFNGSLTVANLIFVSILTEKLFHSFWRFARLLDRASEASEGAQRLADLMNERSTVNNRGEAPIISEPVGICISDVSFAYTEMYNADSGILHEFNLNIEAGSVVALVGPSGAGKTTIRKIITGLVPIQDGCITVAGIPVPQWQSSELLRLFSYVPQGDDVSIFSGTIRENIAFPKPEATDEEVMKAAELAGIHTFIMELEDGYMTVVGERGKRLSGGQKQRLALARAIIADRPVLILDEATSAVDAVTEQEIQAKMKTILAGKTAIIIAHRLSTIWDISHKIVVIDQGRKIEEGTHAQLMNNNGLYARMVALQTAD